MRYMLKSLSWLLIIVMMVSLLMTGCSNSDPATDATSDTGASTAATDPNDATVPSEPESNATITIRAYTPVDWIDVNVWAWKDGGEDVFDTWPGMEMEIDYEEFCFKLTIPGWGDRLILSTKDGEIKTAELTIEPGKDFWIFIMDDLHAEIMYEDPFAGIDYPDVDELEPVYDDPIYTAAIEEDYETFKSLLPSLEDRSILTEWVFNDFNYAYSLEAVQSGDYATAIEFLSYCASETTSQYAIVLQQLIDGDLEAACDTKRGMDSTKLERDLGMSWFEFVCMMTGITADPDDLNYVLFEEYLNRRMLNNQPVLTEDYLKFGEYSTWTSESYIGQITDSYCISVDSLNALYSQCGSEANGKILFLRSQKDFPSGQTYYAIDMNVMEYLSCDLFPSSLSEVEYVILANYSYDVDGNYEQTFSSNSNSIVSYFSFLRMKGQVELIRVNTGETIQSSSWLKGTGEPEAHFSESDFQCSNMPETGADIVAAVEKVRALNEQAD